MNRKILVVEDNENDLALIRDILHYHNYEVITAENGEVGVKKAMEHLPDLILLDIRMPVMDGFAALRQLKSAEETRNIKVIALTSFALVGDSDKIMSAGFDDYIAKPVRTRELPEIMKKIFSEVVV